MKWSLLALCIAFALFASSPAAGQFVLRDYFGTAPFDLLGSAVASGDVDNDGYDDVIVGVRGFDGPAGQNAGRVIVYSGLTGAVLYVFEGAAAQNNLGVSVATADLNNDGHQDVVMGAPGAASQTGRVLVISGADGITQLLSKTGVAAGDQFGYSVANVGNADGDIFDDIVVGAPFHDSPSPDSGQAVVYAGSNGAVLRTFGGTAGSRFGYSVAGAGDVDASWQDDVIIGSPGIDIAEVYSVVSGAMLRNVGGGLGINFGAAVSGAGDIDGDNYDDFAVSSPDFGAGAVFLYSGQTGFPIRTHFGVETGDAFGVSMSPVGDVDDDGVMDLAAGGLGKLPLPGLIGGSRGPGYVQVFSGSDGARIIKIDGDTNGDSFGAAVAGGDVDNDGHADIVVGAPNVPGGPVSMGRAAIIDVAGRYPGSFEDLALSTGIGTAATRAPDVKTANAGSGLVVHLESPSGGYEGTIPVLLAQFFSTGSPPTPFPAFPELALDPSSVVVLFDGSSHPIFGLSLLPPGGLTFLYVIPAGFGGFSTMIQGFSLSPSARRNNPFFTSTNAHEIWLL